ncbi:MAG: bifunctional diguanylate cyclase/phosphodiesterase [Lachnospiraceae bacterium]|nr:bifunctional diguanylate cyclase/phosphodiesterase [Lachnospiraceae bacterium]
MNELDKQISMLDSINKRLVKDSKILKLICDTSNSAFLYYNFEEDSVQTIANWDYFFDFKITEHKDFYKFYDCVEEKYTSPLRETLYIEKRGLKSSTIDVKMKGSRMWLEVESDIIYDDDMHPVEKIIRFKDVTKFNSQNDELTYMAYYDLLTGLYNRNYFVRLLGEFVNRAKENDKKVAVMFLDLDDFRKMNDSLGIIVGDEIVQIFGQFLSELACENVIVSHFSSDLYCIGIYDPCGDFSVDAICRKIFKRSEKPYKLSSGRNLTLTVSIGVAEYPEASTTALELINCAEIVMIGAKTNGKGRVQYFDGSILEEFLKNSKIDNKLKEVDFSQNFVMYFQPQFHTTDKMLRGVEALIRWKDESGKMIRPDVFIPIAEKNGTIVPIGTWIMEESIRIYAGWKQKYHYPMLLSLNVSAIQYKQPDFIDNLINILDKYGVSPCEIELEITESILIDDFKEIIEKLAVLRNKGIKISLDDFGTGYSSLSYLKGLPIDTLKIDKTFIDTVITDENTRIITESIIYMVKRLGLETIAEGVETQEQFDFLNAIDCDNIQGYYLGKPMPPEGIEELIEKVHG